MAIKTPDRRVHPAVRVAADVFYATLAAVLLVTLVLWVASFWRSIELRHISRASREATYVFWHRGRTESYWTTDARPWPANAGGNFGWHGRVEPLGWVVSDPPLPGTTRMYWQIPGSRFYRFTDGPTVFHWLVIPGWVVPLLLSVPVVLWARWLKSRWRNRHPDKGLCSTCGYDLRGHPAGARCPECGTGVPVDAPAVRPAG